MKDSVLKKEGTIQKPSVSKIETDKGWAKQVIRKIEDTINLGKSIGTTRDKNEKELKIFQLNNVKDEFLGYIIKLESDVNASSLAKSSLEVRFALNKLADFVKSSNLTQPALNNSGKQNIQWERLDYSVPTYALNLIKEEFGLLEEKNPAETPREKGVKGKSGKGRDVMKSIPAKNSVTAKIVKEWETSEAIKSKISALKSICPANYDIYEVIAYEFNRQNVSADRENLRGAILGNVNNQLRHRLLMGNWNSDFQPPAKKSEKQEKK